MVKKLYRMFRLLGYTCGFAGFLLITGARLGWFDPPQTMFRAGFGLLIVMFIMFLVSYAVYFANMLKR